jgi:hypothetical protein
MRSDSDIHRNTGNHENGAEEVEANGHADAGDWNVGADGYDVVEYSAGRFNGQEGAKCGDEPRW